MREEKKGTNWRAWFIGTLVALAVIVALQNSQDTDLDILFISTTAPLIVIKRSLSPGFAGIDNDLFYQENTSMLFSDAKAAAQEIAGEVENL